MHVKRFLFLLFTTFLDVRAILSVDSWSIQENISISLHDCTQTFFERHFFRDESDDQRNSVGGIQGQCWSRDQASASAGSTRSRGSDSRHPRQKGTILGARNGSQGSGRAGQPTVTFGKSRAWKPSVTCPTRHRHGKCNVIRCSGPLLPL